MYLKVRFSTAGESGQHVWITCRLYDLPAIVEAFQPGGWALTKCTIPKDEWSRA